MVLPLFLVIFHFTTTSHLHLNSPHIRPSLSSNSLPGTSTRLPTICSQTPLLSKPPAAAELPKTPPVNNSLLKPTRVSISVPDQISRYLACIAFAVRSIIIIESPWDRDTRPTFLFDFFSTNEFLVEMANECVVASEPPHCGQTDARANAAYNV